MSAAIDWSALRKDFPILDQKVHGQPPVYFDNAATSLRAKIRVPSVVEKSPPVSPCRRGSSKLSWGHVGLEQMCGGGTHRWKSQRRVAVHRHARAGGGVV